MFPKEHGNRRWIAQFVYRWTMEAMLPKEYDNRRWIAQFIYRWTMKRMFPKEHSSFTLDRKRHASQRERESTVDRTVRLSLELEYSAMKYDSTIDYKNDPAISTGSHTIVCP